MKEKKIYIKTWGCQMNEYDSSRIINNLKKFYFCKFVKNPKESELIILNTCSVREKAQEKLFHQLGRLKKIKKNNPNLIICVGGCVASQEGENIRKRSSNVDIIFNSKSLHQLPKMINQFQKDFKSIINLKLKNKNDKFHFFIPEKIVNPSAFVSIIEGCNKYCSYCIVPYTRGKEVSRSYKDILFEISQLSKKGVREICLLGQNVNSYKYISNSGKIYSFSTLLNLVSKFSDIYRIKFISSHPLDFNKDLINVYKKTNKLINFLHLPLQSGSDKILKLMKRQYTISDYKEIIFNLRKVRPNILIGSDFIVGFPGETDDDFQKTIEVIEEIDFDISYSFAYSKRPGTKSSRISSKYEINENIKKKRLYILQKKINKKIIKHSILMLNTIQHVLVEGFIKKDLYCHFGRTEFNRVVFFKSKEILIGSFVNVKIYDFHLGILYGELIKIGEFISN